jgi:two-component system chemotaxis sensor kinase CheA
VREKIRQLGGCIAVASESHQGTVFRIGLPITLATFRGVLVQVASQLFVVPTAQVEYVVRVKPETLHTVSNRRTICLKGRIIPLVRLADVLGIQQAQAPEADVAMVPVFILSSAEGGVAFSVDAILQEQEVLVKSLGTQLSRVRNIAAATVLGSGQVVPILHAADLLLAAGRVAAVQERASETGEAAVVRPKSILLAEDSITTRMLLKNILESTGYQVTTAVDGIDAWTALQTDTFDLVLSDVQMPGMSGFDLTAQIRRDAQLADIPVVLVTTLATPEDRERGMEVGANAYIVKSDFDQSNLLGMIRRLV